MGMKDETWGKTGLSITNILVNEKILSNTLSKFESATGDEQRLSKLSISLCSFDNQVWPEFERFLRLLRPKSIQVGWDRKERIASQGWALRLIQSIGEVAGLETLELLNLDLRGAESGKFLERTLGNQRSSLHTFKVMGCLLDEAGIKGLAKGIRHCTSQLERLSLNNCALSETSLSQLFEHGFSKQRSRVTHMELARNLFSHPSSALALSRVVEFCDRLHLLDLSGNQGFLTLQEDRPTGRADTAAIRDGDAIDEEFMETEDTKRRLRCAQRFFASIANHANLKELILMGVNLNNAAATLLFDALQRPGKNIGASSNDTKASLLKTLDLVQNPNLKDGEWFLGVSKLKNLQTLCFSTTLDLVEGHLYESVGCNTSLIWLECTAASFSTSRNEESENDESQSNALQEFQRFCLKRNRFLHKAKSAKNLNKALWPRLISKLQRIARFSHSKQPFGKDHSELFERIQNQILFSFVEGSHTAWLD